MNEELKQKTETYAVIGILMRGTWVPRSWA